MPAGAFAGAEDAFGTVGPNEAALAAGIVGIAGATVCACTDAKCL